MDTYGALTFLLWVLGAIVVLGAIHIHAYRLGYRDGMLDKHAECGQMEPPCEDPLGKDF